MQQAVQHAELVNSQTADGTVHEAAKKQIRLAGAAMPSAEADPAPKHIERLNGAGVGIRLSARGGILRRFTHIFRTACHRDQLRSFIKRFVLEIAFAGLRPFGQVLVQFMMVWHR